MKRSRFFGRADHRDFEGARSCIVGWLGSKLQYRTVAPAGQLSKSLPRAASRLAGLSKSRTRHANFDRGS